MGGQKSKRNIKASFWSAAPESLSLRFVLAFVCHSDPELAEGEESAITGLLT